jgi:predicted nuclease of predicted toxin-antitoxin system
MKLLADENFPRRVVHSLRGDGHDVLSIGLDFPSTGDAEVLDLAEREERVLLTLDRDFWQISMQRRGGLVKSGVMLVRIHPAIRSEVERLARSGLKLGSSLIGHFVLVTATGIDLIRTGV